MVKGDALLPASYTTGTLPTCDANIPGGIVWDSTVSKLKYCDGVSAWVAL